MILIGNGRVITRDSQNPYIENGAVVIEGNRIKDVGTYTELKERYVGAELIDVCGKVIMPGYINAHSHIYSAFARGLNLKGNPPTHFLEILEGTWWHIDRHLSQVGTYYSAISTYIECIKNGVTTVIDHHASYNSILGSLFQIAAAADHLQIRTCLSYEVSDRDGRDKMKEAVNENVKFIEYANKQQSSMIQAMFGMHASFTLSDATIDYCKEQNVHGKGYHIHVAEGAYDQKHALANYGCSVVERLYKKGLLGVDSIAGHCIHIYQEDRELLKTSETTVIHNPHSNMGNGVGSPNVLALLDEGILVGLGTDGFTNDMMESAQLAHILQKHLHKSPDRGFLEAVRLLFENNGTIASRVFKEPIGCLRKEALADIIVVDYQPYTPMDATNFNGHVLFGMRGGQTDTTVINGKLLMKNRELLISDEELLLAKSKEAAAQLWRALG